MQWALVYPTTSVSCKMYQFSIRRWLYTVYFTIILLKTSKLLLHVNVRDVRWAGGGRRLQQEVVTCQCVRCQMNRWWQTSPTGGGGGFEGWFLSMWDMLAEQVVADVSNRRWRGFEGCFLSMWEMLGEQVVADISNRRWWGFEGCFLSMWEMLGEQVVADISNRRWRGFRGMLSVNVRDVRWAGGGRRLQQEVVQCERC
jgi:hypothetical protein